MVLLWRLRPGAHRYARGRRLAPVRGYQHRPEQLNGLPAGVRHDFLLASVNALQPVFLVGAGLTTVAFALAWLLKEVPLRDTMHQAGGLGAEEAVAGATGSEAIVAAGDAPPKLQPR